MGLAEQPVIQKRRYKAYLLRMWREGGGEAPGSAPPVWRASLERPQGGERLGFASLLDLFAFLESETGLGLPGQHLGQAKNENQEE